MALFEDTVSFCGLDSTVRMEDSNGESTIKHRVYDQPLHKIYPLDIQFYTRIPCPIVNEKMKSLVKERILALKEVHLAMRNSDHMTVNDERNTLTAKLGIMRLHRYAKFINSKGHCTQAIEELEDRIADHASFVALRLAVAYNSEEQTLHQRIEEELFHLRISALDDKGMRELLLFNNIDYEKISDDEKIEFKNELTELLDNPNDYDDTVFFKIPVFILLGFTKIYNLHLKNGIAFVPLEKMHPVLRAHYHNYLKYEAASVNINNLETACKFSDGLNKFNEFFQFCRNEFQTMHQKIMRESNISIPMIDMLAKTAFPPCMRIIHEYLRKRHHLKHESRLQYILFLKGIGLKVQDTLTFFRNEFTQSVTLERFEKEYTYYIYHAYGMRGRRYDTPPMDCSGIINRTTPFGDCNGCVFAHTGVADIEDLGRNMSRWNIAEEHIDEILEYTKQGDTGHACATYFHAINKCSLNESVSHPNKFFNESRRLSNLPAGCISDESDESDNEVDDFDLYPETTMDIDEKFLPANISSGCYIEIIQMLIDWETQMPSNNVKGGSMVKLKYKI